MRLSEEALDSLRRVLIELGYSDLLDEATERDLEEFGLYLLNLTAAGVKTRERMRSVRRELPPSKFPDEAEGPVQGAFPGFGN